MTEQRFEVGEVIDISFDKSIVTHVHKTRGGGVITVLTASAQFIINTDAADVTVTKTGVFDDLWRPALQNGQS